MSSDEPEREPGGGARKHTTAIMRSTMSRPGVRHRWEANTAGDLACADCGITIRAFEEAFDRIYDVALTIAEQSADEGDREDATDAVAEADYLGAPQCA
jgi:hypothetical protein